ncbi:DNA-binding response regulator in two-component regulatory system with CreC [uncultured delta proteobacterium]|uniref:DNA-binding response regulator in two-component regulatory system with CreC n=1 Tax=uncultured delta proteobacterium TaxID=34034 RepID=A0A212K2T4_9DELT|nr:DNA-binding response regulator in two-component regulatory system with CreC [uncultured delta proteobacterium]
MQTILVIEDEQSIADTVVHSIEREGHAAVWCERGLEGLERVRAGDCALVVLDVGLPDISGFELCKAIRTFSQVPVIFLTARDDEIDKIVGLEIGADDYVTKPFSPRELTARIKTVLRRSAAGVKDTKGEGEKRLRIDPDKLQAVFAGRKLDLTRYEFKLLALLAAHPGRVYSREAIMDAVWGGDSPSLDRTVDAHVKSLRAKLREIDGSLDMILTHRGMGYALRDDA